MRRTDDDAMRGMLNDRRRFLLGEYTRQLERATEQNVIDDLTQRIAGINRWLELDRDYAN